MQKFCRPTSRPKVWSGIGILGFLPYYISDLEFETFGRWNLDPTPTLRSCVQVPAFPSITICPVFWPHPFFCWGKSGRRSQLLVDKTNCAHTSKKNTATIERKKGNRVDTLEICHDISASDVCPASGTTNLPPRYTAHTTSQNPHEKPNHWCLLTFWSSRITFDAGATFNLPNKINSNSLHPTANHEIRRKISGQLSWA